MKDATIGTDWAKLCTVALSVATAAFVWVCASYIYQFSSDGVSYLIGQWFGTVAVSALIAFVGMRGQESRKWRVPAALAVALAFLVTARTKDIVASMDMKAGADILANVKSIEDLNKAIKENPDNLLMRVIKAGMLATQETEQRLQAVIESLNGKELDLDVRQPDLPSLQRQQSELRKAENNVVAAQSKLSQIFDDQLSAVRTAVNYVTTDDNLRASYIKGFARAADKRAEVWKRYLEALINTLHALDRQVAFLISVNGRYEWNPQLGRIVFHQNDDLQAFISRTNELGSAIAEMEGTQAEIDALTQFHPFSYGSR